MDDKLNLKKYIRTVNDFPIPGIKFRDITSLNENPEGLIKSCNAFTSLTKEYGATILCGCCDTNPNHIREISSLK